MKTRNFFKNSTLVLLPLLLSVTAFSTTKNIIETKAGSTPTEVSPKTTNIDLNDSTEAEIKSYYSDLSSLSASELTGTNLLKNLKPLLKNGMNYLSYANVWKAYEITDRNWQLSPVSSDTGKGITYDSATNKYSAYQYSTSVSSINNNPYTMALYRNDNNNSETAIRNWDSHQTTTYMTNREHCWPQSRGFKADSGAYGPAGTDLHHLMSADGRVNQTHHNNKSYGFVDKTKLSSGMSEYEAEKYKFIQGNYYGLPLTVSENDEEGITQDEGVFEPLDCFKGDIARACFYMVARYNNLKGDTGVISQYEPNLTLNPWHYNGSTSIISSDTKTVSLGNLKDLLAWHKLDPVDEYEIHRNNLIYKNYQNNRNPFVDYPEWADYIWGTAEYDAVNKVVNYDPTSTGSVDLNEDVINGYRGSEPVVEVLSSIGLSGTYKTSFNVGESFSSAGLIVTATYESGKTKTVTPTSITGYDLSTVGNQNVIVSYTENGITKTASYQITVKKVIETKKTFKKISSLDEIESGSNYVLGYVNNDSVVAFPSAFTAERPSGNTLSLSSDTITSNSDNIIKITKNTESTYYVYSESAEKYLMCGTSSAITYGTSPTSLSITCNDGKFSIGDSVRGIAYRASTYNTFGNYTKTNVDESQYFSLSLFKETIKETYSLLDSVDNLKDGDHIIIAARKTESDVVNSYGLSKTYNSKTKYIEHVSLTGNVDELNITSTTDVITIKRSGNVFSLLSSNGSYLAATSGTDNQIQYLSEINEYAQFSINKSGECFQITSKGDTTKNTIRYNSSYGRFTCYLSDSVSPVYIYKNTNEIEADVWGKDFIDGTAPKSGFDCNTSNWSTLASSYSELSVGAKTLIQNSTYVSKDSSDMSWRAQAVARYDYMISQPKFGVTPFIEGRNVNATNSVSLFKNSDSSIATVLIIVISITGLSIIGCYYFYSRKKKING